jgi:hypothetical protein
MGFAGSVLFWMFCGGVAYSQVIQMLKELGCFGASEEDLVAPIAIFTGTDDRCLVLSTDGDVVEVAVAIGTLETFRN